MKTLIMTDHCIDELFERCLCDKIINQFSRLVFDPERFRDDKKEEMALNGMGAIYTRTSKGKILRQINYKEREAMLQKYYDETEINFWRESFTITRIVKRKTSK